MVGCSVKSCFSSSVYAPEPKKEERDDATPATTLPDADAECDDSFGCQTDSEGETPSQLTAGPPPPPMDAVEEAPRQLQAGPPPPLSSEEGTSARTTAPAAPAKGSCQEGKFSCHETFFVFDYDDTILPSTWIQRQKLRLDSASRPTPEQMAVLGEAAEIAGKTLRLARQRGTVIFITNAERGWIELSCQKFMPTLAPMLENIRLISARTSYEGPSAVSPLDWKLRAFEDNLSRHFGADALADPHERKNILSLGDGIHEREALLASTSGLPNCCAKSLKFVERPDISQIMKQHELISSAFDNIVNHTDHLDLRIRCP